SRGEIFGQCAWSPDCTRLAVPSLIQVEPRQKGVGYEGFDNEDCEAIVTILDAQTGAERAVLSSGRQKRNGLPMGHGGECLVWSPTGNRIAVSNNLTLTIFPLESSAPHMTLVTIWDGQVPISFSPDGSYIAACRPGTNWAQIWNSATGEEIPLGATANLAWHPNGRWVAGAGEGVIKVLDLDSGRSLLTVPIGGSRRSLVRCAWSADGTRLAYGSGDDQHVSVWAMPVGRESAVVFRPGSKRADSIRELGNRRVVSHGPH